MSKVLIIEDERDLLEMYQVQFEAADFDAFTADNLDDGFKLAKKEKPDVILLDLLLSQKEVTEENNNRGGYVLLDKLMADPETRKIKVIVFSNLDTQEDREAALKKGACEYLIKSEVTPKEIIKIVGGMIEKGECRLQDKK
jgi:CheY-like chemotaxis protein